MPGPIKAPSQPQAREAPLIEVVSTTGPIGPLPDPTPYQSTRDLRMSVPGGVVTVTETYWTMRGLRRWLRACPKEMVRLRLPTGLDPRDPEAPKTRPYYYDGFRFDVPYEETTAIPAPIAELVRQSQDPFPTTASRGLDLYAITPRTPQGRLLGDAEAGPADESDEEDAPWSSP